MFYGMCIKPCHSLPALPPHRKFETRPSSAATEPTLHTFRGQATACPAPASRAAARAAPLAR